MKRSEILLILLLFLAIPLSSALEISLSKESYQPQETLQAEITSITNLAIKDILLYKQGTPRPMPVVSNLLLKNNIYYLYIILPNQEGDFYITIDENIKNFTILQSQKALQINPGFIFTTADFSIMIKSLYESQTINAQFESQNYEFFLIEDLQEELEFSIQGLNGRYDLTINDYNIPVFILQEIPEPINDSSCTINCTDKTCGDDGCSGSCGTCLTGWCDNYICINDPEDCEDECEEDELKCFGNYSKICSDFDEDNCLEWGNETKCDLECKNGKCVNQTTSTNLNKTNLEFKLASSSLKFLSIRILGAKDSEPINIILENTGEEDLEDIEITSDFNAKINPKKTDIKAGEKKVIELIINLDEDDVDEKNRRTGKIKAEIKDQEFSLPVYIELTNDESKIIIPETKSSTYLHCSEVGVICESDEECDTTTIGSVEGSCCPGTCEEPGKSNSRWLIGLFIILILFVIATIVFIKIKRKPKGSPKDLLEKKTSQFQNRMKGKEVSNNLKKV